MLISDQLSHWVHRVETGIQDIKITTATSPSPILQAASDMSQYLAASSKSLGGKLEIMPPLTKIKDAVFACKESKSRIKQD